MDETLRREYLFKEVDLVQSIIERMGNNSFFIKGAAITLVAASLLLQGGEYHYLAAFLPWFMFWYLDGYFLRIERLYRKLYEWLIANRLTSEEYLLDMSRKNLEARFGKKVAPQWKVMFSQTLIIFYGLLLLLIILLLVICYYI
jgi:hypothetical protein